MADDLTGKGQGGRLPSRYSDQFQTFRTEMDRLFDSFLTGMPSLANLRQAFPAAQGLTPAWDVKETEKELVVKADLPGIDEKDIQLTILDGVLSLRGEKKSETTGEHENYHLMERSYGSFHRSIRLPETVDEDKVEASFDKGVLTVTLPKRPEMVKAQKKIEIKSS
ncbi:MAG: Hsp20/alpha crystallin family protein [Rhodomicrobium sp.]